MSVEAMTLALCHSRSSGTAKLVLIGLANHHHPTKGGIWPSMATLAKYAGVSERNARAGLAKLVELGEVKVVINKGGQSDHNNGRRPNLYQLLLACPEDCDGTTYHRPKEAVEVAPAEPPVDERADASDRPPRMDSTAQGGREHPPNREDQPAPHSSDSGSVDDVEIRGASSSKTPRASRQEEHAPKKIQQLDEALKDALPGRFYRQIRKAIRLDVLGDLHRRRITPAELHLAIRHHDWDSANSAGAVLTWLRELDHMPADPDCRHCRGTGYINYTGGNDGELDECSCIGDDSPRLSVPGVDFDAA